jgi:hypothetical protein
MFFIGTQYHRLTVSQTHSFTAAENHDSARSIGAGLAGTHEAALTFAPVDLDIGGTAVDGYLVATITGDTPDRYSVTTASEESYEIGSADGFYEPFDR